MADFVLVHGAWHGGWCWRKLVRELEALGHRASAPDLPGHGGDTTPHDRIDVQAYTDRVCDTIDDCPGDVVLVGHSLGGLTISQVAEHRHDRLRSLVYLAAFVPLTGGTIAETTQIVSSGIQASVTPSPDGLSSVFDGERAREVFYGDCSEQDVQWARERLCPQPMQVFRSVLQLSEERFGSVPRDYIVCLRDEALTVAGQERMAERGFRNVYRLDRSHSPFLSAPQELAKILGEVAVA